MTIQFTDSLKQWEGDNGWFYVRLPKNMYDDLREIGFAHKRGFGSIKVRITVGYTTWETSIFPDYKDKSYILFIKKSVRFDESLSLSDIVSLLLEVKT